MGDGKIASDTVYIMNMVGCNILDTTITSQNLTHFLLNFQPNAQKLNYFADLLEDDILKELKLISF